MIDVHPSVVIDRPRDQVARVMFDPANDAAWTTGVVAVRPLSPGVLREGSVVERDVKFLGRRFSYRYEVVAAGDGFVEMQVAQPFPMTVRYTLTDEGHSTRAAIRARGDATGFFKVAAPLMAPLVRRNIARDLAGLKRLVEATPR